MPCVQGLMAIGYVGLPSSQHHLNVFDGWGVGWQPLLCMEVVCARVNAPAVSELLSSQDVCVCADAR